MRYIAALLALFLIAPLASYAQTDPAGDQGDQTAQTPSADAPYRFQRQGIFDCNLNGAYAMSIGSMTAGGGAYVPVADATVELNTGILVYKECVLREVVDREREAATAAFGKRAVIAIKTARNGNPLYVVNERKEELNVSDAAFLPFLRNEMNSLNPVLKSPVQRALAQSYEAQTRNAQEALACPYKGDLSAMLRGNPSNVWDAVLSLGSSCNPLIAYNNSRQLAEVRIATAVAYQRDQWQWGNGYYAVTDNNDDPLLQNVLTPSITVQESFQTILDSPVRQLESANDIGQMISALYGGMTTQIISDSQGLAGLTQSFGGQPSYLDQVAAESSQGVRNAAANAAIQILSAARQVEAQYFQAVNGIASVLTQTIAQLRSAENQCWNLITQRVCTGNPPGADNVCTDSGGARFRIATSTAFSQPIVNSQITPLANAALASINASRRALSLIDGIIQGITNTQSLDAQRIALQQLDALVYQHALHIQPDLANVTTQYTNVQSTMSTLVQNTVQSWADGAPSGSVSPSNPAGWCNVNNPGVVNAWKSAWQQ
ncbi:MAG: hypothetical protein RLZZ416_343 [Candidatus Parcubacteria bacterium]|jgi:hypothetical protein